VVHLAGDPDPRHSFEVLVDPNIRGWWSVLETAYRLGVPRVAFASSLHVSGAPTSAPDIRPADAQTPGNPYGVSKLFGEHAGRLFHRLTGMEVASLRLGLVATSEADLAYSIKQHGQSDFIVSMEDASRAFEAVLTVPELGYAQFNVTSNCDSHQSRFPLGADAARVGYVPQDNFSSVDLRSG
jgi:L-arabinose 1-dehydrogenase [NAD(P)+]